MKAYESYGVESRFDSVVQCSFSDLKGELSSLLRESLHCTPEPFTKLRAATIFLPKGFSFLIFITPQP